MKVIAIKARKTPKKLSLDNFSLKRNTPTKVPNTITPTFILAKTVEGFSEKTLCAFR